MNININHNTFVENFIDTFGKEYSYIPKAIENNNHKKLPFLNYLSSQGFIPAESEESLQEMIKIFENKFQGNQDLAFNVVEEKISGTFHLMLYFKVLYPEVTIINSNKEKHTIKNLVVVFPLKWSEMFKKWTIDELSGLRLTLSYLELYHQYGHSHLQSNNLGSCFKEMITTRFCLGSSTLGTTIAEYNTESDREKSKLLLEGILYTLDTYVAWESLEGVPYNYVKRLLPLGGETVNADYISSHSEQIINYLKSNKIFLALDYGVTNDNVFIKNTLKNSEFFKRVLAVSTLTNRRTIESQYLCFSNDSSSTSSVFIRASSSFYSLEKIIDNAKNYKENNLHGIEDKFTFFNGRKYPLVYSHYMGKTIDKDKQNIIIYPKFLEYVYRKLEFEIQKTRLRSQTIKYLNTLKGTKRSSRQNQVTL